MKISQSVALSLTIHREKVIYKWDLMGEKFAGANCPLAKANNLRKKK